MNDKLLNFKSSNSKKVTSREGSTLEFKKSFNWSSKSEYAKTVAAFSNNTGGSIIFGVTDNPRELIGINPQKFNNLDEGKIAEYLNAVFSPEIKFKRYIKRIRNQYVGIIEIFEAIRKPIVAIKTDREIKEAEIYYRYSGRSEKIKYPELKALLDAIKEEEQNRWTEILKQIARVGTERIAVMEKPITELSSDEFTLIKNGQKKSTGQKPIEVQITSNKNVPEIRFEEKDFLLQYPLNYKKLTNILKKRYSNFRADPRYHQIKKNYQKDEKFCKYRRVDPRNPKSTGQFFYEKGIIKEFDKFYKLK